MELQDHREKEVAKKDDDPKSQILNSYVKLNLNLD